MTAFGHKNSQTAAAALGLFGLALALRFFGLGDWAFFLDEPATVIEQAAFFGADIVKEWDANSPIVKVLSDDESQLSRLPRIVPLGYLPSYAGTLFWGHTEFGTRAFIAILGSLLVPVAFLILVRGNYPRMALPFSLLLAVWPRHIYYSQLARFYGPCSFFSFIAILLAYRYATDRSPSSHHVWLSVLCCLFAISCHTVSAWLLLALPLLIMATRGSGQGTQSDIRRAMWAYGIGIALFGAVYLAYLRPLLDGWNSHRVQPTILTVIATLVRRYEVSIVLLAGLGTWAATWRLRAPHSRFVCGGIALFVAACLAMRVAIQFDTIYMFSASAFVLLAAASGMAGFFHFRWAGRNRRVALIVAAMSPMMVSLISYYSDGNREDVRVGLRYVRDHWTPHDRLLGMEMYALVYPGLFHEHVAPAEYRDYEGDRTEWRIVQARGFGIAASQVEALERDGWVSRLSYHKVRLDPFRYEVHVFSRRQSSTSSQASMSAYSP